MTTAKSAGHGNGAASQVAPMVERVGEQAGALAQRGMDAINDTSRRLRDRALTASDNTVQYIQTEPFKAVLIAVATGAALMALGSLVVRSRGHG
jgi:ElaB/YqjD/DUF883 family membrane-anchored ribosome-binding protein